MLKYQHMATSKKPPIPRFLQKMFIISAALFFVSQLIIPALQGITAIPAGAQVFNAPWFYYNAAAILAPALYAAFSYWRLPKQFGKLWRATSSIALSMTFVGLTEVVNSLYYAISSSLYYSNSNPVPYWTPYLTLAVAIPVSLLAIYLITRRIHPKTIFSVTFPLRLLIIAVSLYVLSIVTSTAQAVMQNADSGIFYTLLISIVLIFTAVVSVGYMLINPKLKPATRLLYALIFAVIAGNVYMIVNTVLFNLPSIINTSLMDIERFFIPSVVILLCAYVGTLLFVRVKKLL